jgi:bacterioferritin
MKQRQEFTLDLERIRGEARRGLEEGAVTPHYRGNRAAVIRLLDAALATEWLCVLRYYQHSHTAAGIDAETVSEHFAEHARQELDHALRIGERIKQLGGTPSMEPTSLSARSHTEYNECDTLMDMIKENLIAERIAIASYTEMIQYLGTGDPTTRRMLEKILAVEEEHADELADLLAAFDPRERLS